MSQPKITPDQMSNTYYFSGRTTNNTLTEIFLNGKNGERIYIPDNTTYGIQCEIVGRRTDGGGEASAYYCLGGFAKCDTGVPVVNHTHIATYEDVGAYDGQVVADGVNHIAIKVQGQTGHTMEWRAVVRVIPVSG